MRTLHDETHTQWRNSAPEVQKDDIVPILLAMLDRIEVLEQQVRELSETRVEAQPRG